MSRKLWAFFLSINCIKLSFVAAHRKVIHPDSLQSPSNPMRCSTACAKGLGEKYVGPWGASLSLRLPLERTSTSTRTPLYVMYKQRVPGLTMFASTSCLTRVSLVFRRSEACCLLRSRRSLAAMTFKLKWVVAQCKVIIASSDSSCKSLRRFIASVKLSAVWYSLVVPDSTRKPLESKSA